MFCFFFFFSSRRRHTRFSRDWSSDVCSSDLFDAVVGGSAEFAGGQLAEPAFDEVQPGPAGGSEVQVEAGVGGQPLLDRRGLVGGVVVADQVQVQLGGGVLVDGFEEPEE